MQYISTKRFNGKAICGYVDIPELTVCDTDHGFICWNGDWICSIGSDNSEEFFARNDDGNGLLRGKLTHSIQSALENTDDDYQKRWDKVWADPVCQKYRRKDYDDYWLWEHDFFEADIETLRYIAGLVGAKEDE